MRPIVMTIYSWVQPEMKVRIIIILLLLTSLMSCHDEPRIDQYSVVDQTRYRPFDSTLTDYHDSISFGQLQNYYNEEKMKHFHKLLRRLNLSSLREYATDTTAYRLIIDFAWGSVWSGSPLALTVCRTDDSATIESVELKYNSSDSRSTDIFNPVRQQLNYRVGLKQFLNLDSILNEQGLWQNFSFEANDGWMIFDNDKFFIEARNKSEYKLLVRENEFSYYKDILLPFLNATGYNDTMAIEFEKYYE